MVVVGPSVQKDSLLAARIVTAGIERYSVRTDCWSFGFVESWGGQTSLDWTAVLSALCLD